MADWPTRQSEELSLHAQNFAEDLVGKLVEFNERYPQPEIGEDAWQVIQNNYGENIPGFTPPQMRDRFEMVFCLYMGSRYGIVP